MPRNLSLRKHFNLRESKYMTFICTIKLGTKNRAEGEFFDEYND